MFNYVKLNKFILKTPFPQLARYWLETKKTQVKCLLSDIFMGMRF